MSACLRVNDILCFNNVCWALLDAPFVLLDDCITSLIAVLVTFYKYKLFRCHEWYVTVISNWPSPTEVLQMILNNPTFVGVLYPIQGSNFIIYTFWSVLHMGCIMVSFNL